MARSKTTGGDTTIMDTEPSIESVNESIEGTNSISSSSEGSISSSNSVDEVFIELNGKLKSTTLDNIDPIKYKFVGLSGTTRIYRLN